MKTRLLAIFLILASLAVVQGQVLIRVQQGNNISPIGNGGSVTVNATGVGQPKLFQITITYIGTTSLTFPRAPELLGSQDFSITRPPPASAVLTSNQSLTIELQYLPTSSLLVQSELDYGFLQSAPAPTTAGQPVQPPTPGIIAIGLNGTAPEYSLNYGLAIDGNIVNAPPGGTLNFTETVVNSATLASVAVVNRGSGAGQVQSVTTTGDAFSLISLPLLPSLLPVGANIPFQIRYRPRQAGSDTGTLTVTFEGGGIYRINLIGRGIVSYLTYEVLLPDGTTQAIVPNQAIQLPAVAVGDKLTVFVSLRNTSTLDISVPSIAVAGTSFQLGDLPFLPVAMPPGDVQFFSLTFSPATAGRQTGRLRVGSDAFDLIGGIGGEPGPLPDFTIQGPTSAQPFQQPSVSLTLASAYAVALTGTITLTTESEVAASDPSVQFVTGGRVAAFTIPAGSTRAVFASGSNQIRIQTGSLASTIVLTPAFATEGGFDLTPKSPKQFRVSVPASAPQLVSASVDLRTANGFTLALVGYTTTRSLTKASVTFKGRPGYNFPQTDFTVDLTASSFLWFSSELSVPFGGQFLIQIPFSISNTSSSAVPPIQAIESATVTLTNSVGTSNTLTVPVQ